MYSTLTEVMIYFALSNIRCGALIRNFSQECADCISTLGPNVCLASPADRFQRTYGLMLLSRRELKDTRASGYNPQSQFHGYLRATVSRKS